MFEHCTLVNKKCGFCAKWKKELYCGLATNPNKVKYLKKCPKEKLKRKRR